MPTYYHKTDEKTIEIEYVVTGGTTPQDGPDPLDFEVIDEDLIFDEIEEIHGDCANREWNKIVENIYSEILRVL